MAIEETGVKLIAEGSDRFNRDIREAERYLNAFIGSVESGSRDIDRSMGGAEQSIERFTSSTESNFRQVDAATEILTGAFRYIGEVAVSALMKAGEATAQFMSDSVSVAGNFEATLNRFAAVTGDSLASAGMDVEEFSDLFLEMGAVTQYSAGEAAEAAVNLAKGGMDPATIAAGGLAGALSLAAAGELELAEAAEITAKQLGVWASTGVTAADVADRMAQAANASTVDVDELALGLAQVGGVAKLTGLTFEETTQAMALLAPGFGSASDAGTSFKMFLSGLVPTTQKAKDAMTDLGLATSDGQSVFFDAEGNFIGMEQAAGLLAAATANLSEEEQQLALKTIFGQDAIRAAALIAEQGATGFNTMGEAMAAAGGAAEQAEARNKGYNFALEEMRGSLETLQIVLGDALLPLLTEFIQQHITPGINRVMEFAKALTESEEPLETFAYLVRDSIPWFKDVMHIIYSNDPFGTFVAKMDKAIPGFGSFVESVNAAVQTVRSFGESTIAVFESWWPSIEAAMLVVGSVITAVIDTLTSAWDRFTADFRDSDFDSLLKTFGILWTSLQPIVLGVLQVLGAAVLVFIGVFTGMLSGALNAADYFVMTLTGIGVSLSIIFDGYVDLIGGAMDLIGAIFDGNTKSIVEAFKRMGTGIVEIFFGAFTLVFSLVTGLGATILSFIEGFVLGIIEFFARLYHELVGGSIVVDLVNDILEWIGKLPAQGVQLISDMVTGVKDLFTGTDWGAIGQGIIDGITGGITSAAGALATAATSAASSAYTAVTDFLGMSSPSKLFMDVGNMTMQGLALGIDEGALQPISALESALSGLAIDIPEMMGQPVAPAASGGQSVVNNYNGDTIYQGDSFGLNVRTPENTGTVGNTIRALQSLSSVKRG